MAYCRRPRQLEFSLQLGSLKIRVFLTDNLQLVDREVSFSIPHSHPHLELRFFESGTCLYTVSDTKINCKSGQYLLIPPNTIHFLNPADNMDAMNSCSHYSLQFSLLFKQPMPELEAYFDRVQLVQPNSTMLLYLLNALRDALQIQEPSFLHSIRGILLALLAEVLRHAGNSAMPLFPDDTALYDGHIHSIMEDYFHCHFMDNCTIGQLAQELNMSNNMVSQAVKRIYGMTFTQKLRLIRVESAKLLLHRTDRSIADIAVSCGFTSSSAFYSAFQVREQCSPSQYRSRYCGVNQEEKRDSGDSSS